MAGIAGKTIDQLTQITEIDDSMIIPLSVLDTATGRYVTRGITLPNLFKLIKNEIEATNNRVTETNEEVIKVNGRVDSTNSKIDETAEQFDEKITTVSQEIDQKIDENIGDVKFDINEVKIKNAYQDTALMNTLGYIAYNSTSILRLGGDIHEVAHKLDNTSSYVTDVVAYHIDNVTYSLNELASYTHSGFAENDRVDAEQEKQITTNTEVNAEQEDNLDAINEFHKNPWESWSD